LIKRLKLSNGFKMPKRQRFKTLRTRHKDCVNDRSGGTRTQGKRLSIHKDLRGRRQEADTKKSTQSAHLKCLPPSRIVPKS